MEPHSFEEPEREYRPIQPEPAWRSLLRKLWAPIAAAALLFWKLKFVALAILKLKVFATAGSMLVSTAAYALLWGWKFGVGFVLLIFVHEMGHVLEAKRQGLKVTAPLFIPFLGAAILMKEQPQSVWREAKMAAAGPIAGGLGSAAVWALGAARDSELLVALAFVGFLINLFNLAPVWQLDGGRIISAVHPALWIPGLAGVAVLMFFYPSPILILIVVLGALQAWSWWQHRDAPEHRRYYQATPAQRLAAGAIYLGLAVLFALGMNATHIEKNL